MIPAIIVSVLAFLFGVVAGIVILWGGLLAVALGGAAVILLWRLARFIVRMTWRVVALVARMVWRIVVGVFKLVRFTILAALHVGGDLAPLAIKVKQVIA